MMQFFNILWSNWRDNATVNRIVRNTSWLLSGQVIVGVINLIQVVIVTRALGIEQYGILALIVTYTSIIYEFLDSRLWETIIKYIPIFQEQDDNARAVATIKLCYFVDIVMAFVATLILWATASLAATHLIKDTDQVALLLLFAFWPLLVAPDETASAIVRLADRFDWLSYRSIFVAIVKLIGMALVLLTNGGLGMVIVVLLLSSGISTAIIVILAQKSMKTLGLNFWTHTPISLLKNRYRELFQFTMLNNLTATSQMLTRRIDIIVLGLFTTPDKVGIYELAKRVVAQFNIIANPIYSAIYPEISKLVAKREFMELRRVQLRVGRSMFLLILIVCIGVTIVSPWIIPPVFGDDFSGSVILVQIMIWRLLWLTMVWFPAFMLAIGYVWQNTLMMWTTTILYIGMLAWLVPTSEATGAATATLLQGILWLISAALIYQVINKKVGQHNDVTIARD